MTDTDDVTVSGELPAGDAAAALRHPGGRPTLYRFEFCEIVANLCINGATDFEVSEFLEIDTATLYRWRIKHPEFRDALRAGKELCDERVERSLYHRAVGYTHRAVKIMQDKGCPVIVPYTEHLPPDTNAAMLWLANRRGWRSGRSEHTVQNPDGSPLIPAAKAAALLGALFDDEPDAQVTPAQDAGPVLPTG